MVNASVHHTSSIHTGDLFMRQPLVFVTRRIPEAGLALLRAACQMDLWESDLPPSPDALLAHARQADGLLCLLTDRVDAALMDACPHLRVIGNLAVGYDNISIPAATERGIVVGNTPDVLTETTADLAFALLLAAARRLPEAAAYVQADRWQTWDPLLLLGHEVHGATLGLLGMGEIGAAVARRARGFGMRVIYAAPHPKPNLERELGVTHVDFATLLRESDFVSLHAPLNDSTRGLFDRAAFQAMRPTAYLINTARGPLVQTEALIEALSQRWIAGAALDVTDPEPLRADHPLLRLPNCLIVPHIGSATAQTRAAMSTLAARNILAGLRGAPLPHPVNPDAAGHGRSAMPSDYTVPEEPQS
jgi:glyoxylate reductase